MIPAVCQQTIQTAYRHITQVTLKDVPLRTQLACYYDPQVQAAAAEVDRIAQRGDVRATEQVCQAWNRAYRRALERHQEASHAATQ